MKLYVQTSNVTEEEEEKNGLNMDGTDCFLVLYMLEGAMAFPFIVFTDNCYTQWLD